MPPECIDCNINALTKEEMQKLSIELLPSTLQEAVSELKKDTFVQGVLGSYVSQKYIEAKQKEWDEYKTQITNWEVEKYLYKV